MSKQCRNRWSSPSVGVCDRQSNGGSQDWQIAPVVGVYSCVYDAQMREEDKSRRQGRSHSDFR